MTLKIQRLLARAKKLTKKGELEESKKIYSAILKSSPENQEAKKELSILVKRKQISPTQKQINEVIQLYSSGQMQNALTTNQLLLKNFPNEPLLLNINGVCFSQIGPIESAIDSFKKAIALKPDYIEAYYNLGAAFQRIHKLDDATECYEKAITLKHSYPEAHNNLGIIMLERNQLDIAVKSFEWAVAYNPNYAEAYNNLGAVYQELNQFENAIKQYQKAITINPEYAQAFNNLGCSCEILGFENEALIHYEKAITCNPGFAEAYRNLSNIKKFTEKDPQIGQMQSLNSSSDVSLSEKVQLNFALAKVNENLGNYDKFFKFLNEGNRLRKQELNYSFTESINFHSILLKVFSSSLPIIKESTPKTSNIQPIFIVGMPRSGTSLVEQIIASHHNVHGAGELTNFKKILSPILENHLNQNKEAFLTKDILSIRKQYLDSLSRLNVPETVITDKMPTNFRLIGFILSAFPEAKIIHLKRDARATCWSIYKHYFSSGNGFTFNQEDLVEFYGLYSELMAFWHDLFPDKIYDINYEELTKNQKDETKKLLEYCDLEWDENCLNFHTNKRAVKTASTSQVRKKIYQGSSEDWKKYEQYIQPLIKGLSSY